MNPPVCRTTAWPDRLSRWPMVAVALLGIGLGLSRLGLAVETGRELKPIRLSERVYYVQGESGPASLANQGFMSNAGFVVGSDQVVVIDALGTPVLGEALLAAIRKVTSLPVKNVVVTHYHADHYYGLSAFKTIGATIWAQRAAEHVVTSEQAAARLEQRKRDLPMFVDEDTRLLPPDRLIDGETMIKAGDTTLRLMPVGSAHSPEDLMVLVEPDGVLFAGDLFFAGRVPYVGDAKTAAWIKALGDMRQSAAKIVVPGHGPASADPLPAINLTERYLTDLRRLMGEAVARFESFDEAYANADWSVYRNLPAFDAANRGNAYGVYLEMEQASLGTTVH